MEGGVHEKVGTQFGGGRSNNGFIFVIIYGLMTKSSAVKEKISEIQ
jgi:hypothetical protein